jgi:hypothetical protein
MELHKFSVRAGANRPACAHRSGDGAMKVAGLMVLFSLLFALSPAARAANTWYVNGVGGSNRNDCKSSQTACRTIGAAISLAASGDSVMIAAATYPENLTINVSLALIGSGPKGTIIDGTAAGRVVTIPNSGTVVRLSKMTIRRGVASGGGGILNAGTLTVSLCVVTSNSAAGNYSVSGGGIYNSGVLSLNYSTVIANGGGNNFVYGGGVYNSGTVLINNSTISGNSAMGISGGGGGGVYNDYSTGVVVITNSTISGNSASGYGGGGVYNSLGTVLINSSTLSGNGATTGNGGNISNGGTAVLQNTIVANSSAAGNCYGTLKSKGYNLSSDSSCGLHGPGDQSSLDPMLGPLQSNGGPTLTQALPVNSPAIDAGNPAGCTDSKGNILKIDQRGYPRPDAEDAGGCDIGAVDN